MLKSQNFAKFVISKVLDLPFTKQFILLAFVNLKLCHGNLCYKHSITEWVNFRLFPITPFIIFSASDITNYLAYLEQPFKSSQGLILILFSVKLLVKLREKNGMYRCFFVNCLFENFSLNLPFLTRSFYFLKKKKITLTLSSLSHTYIHVYCKQPLTNLPSASGITYVLNLFSDTLKSLQT